MKPGKTELEKDEKQLLKEYLEEDNLNSLYVIIFERYSDDLKAIVAKMLGTNNFLDIEGCLSDFYDHLIKPTEKGEKKLRSYNPEKDLLHYMKKALRNFITDIFRECQKLTNTEKPIDENSSYDYVDDSNENHTEVYLAILKSLYSSNNLAKRDRYIMLTFLLAKVANPKITDREIIVDLSEQLNQTTDAVKKAKYRVMTELKKNIKNLI